MPAGPPHAEKNSSTSVSSVVWWETFLKVLYLISVLTMEADCPDLRSRPATDSDRERSTRWAVWALDAIRSRYGADAVVRGSLLSGRHTPAQKLQRAEETEAHEEQRSQIYRQAQKNSRETMTRRSGTAHRYACWASVPRS